jgi:RHS repeat-associated protein
MKLIENKTRKIEEEFVNKKWVTKTRKIKESYVETNTYFYQKDYLGSIIAITDETGTIVEEYVYDIFGKPYSKQIDWKITKLNKSPVGNTRMYTGREYDRGLKIYYNRARYYDRKLARFISRDPIDIADDVNLYAYVGNNSVMFMDLMGTEKVLILYSWNHWYDSWSTKVTSFNLKNDFTEQWYDVLEPIKIKSSKDFIYNINKFSEENKVWEIVYMGHNQWWLSINLFENDISKLNIIETDIELTLFSCETIMRDDEVVTWSNQIAQKLSNQLNIPVTGSNELIEVENNLTLIKQDSWITLQPWGRIKNFITNE